jgi:Ni/Fe-hydrogenase subunit HybB-like protein
MALNITTLFNENALSLAGGALRVSPNDPSHIRRGKRALQFLLVMSLLGATAGIYVLFTGHHALGTTSEIPWGVLISTYVFFVVSSTGLCLVSSLGHVFGFKTFLPIAKRAIFFALVTLLIGFGVIATELERPFRLALMAVISPNFSAPIWWMGALYGLYMVLISAELFFLIKEDHRRARIVGAIGVIAAIAAHSNLGAVFGLLHARPFWYGPLMPIYFIASALVCGAAILMLIVYFTDYFGNNKQLRDENQNLLQSLGKLLALFVGIVIFFTIWKIIVGISGGHYHKSDVMLSLLVGKLFFSFWGMEMLVGLLIPFGILMSSKRKEPGYLAAAAALPMIGIFFVRYNFVYAGQMFSLKRVVGKFGEQISYSPPFKGQSSGFLPYTPSLAEMGIVVGAISAAILAYVIGSRILKLREEVSHD